MILEICVLLTPADSPTRIEAVGFSPPAIKDAHVEATVDSGFHSAGPTGFPQAAWGTEPDVRALHQVTGHDHVIVLDEDDPAPELFPTGQMDDLADQFLGRIVLGVSFAGK